MTADACVFLTSAPSYARKLKTADYLSDGCKQASNMYGSFVHPTI